MAKLHARPIIEEIDDSSDPTKFDAELEKVLIEHGDNAEEFLKSVFGFLDRKTRFFKQQDVSKRLAKLSSSHTTTSGKGVKGGFFGQAPKASGASKVSINFKNHMQPLSYF